MPIQLRVGDRFIAPGRMDEVRLDEDLTVKVYSGLASGPRVFIIAGLHGDERLNLELAKGIGGMLDPRHLHGIVMLVPAAAHEAIEQRSHNLPGGGDLNRSFPGNAKGDGAQRLAYLLFREVVTRSDFGIDLHAAPEGRLNLPHLRGNLENAHVRRLCESFGATVIIDSPGPPRSLRRAATEFGVPTITFEVGGAGRGEKAAIQEGMKGVLGVLSNLRMMGGEIPWRGAPTVVRDTRWLEAPKSGRLDILVQPGAILRTGDVIARVEGGETIAAPKPVMVIGVSSSRTVQAGDPVCMVGTPLEPNNHKNADTGL